MEERGKVSPGGSSKAGINDLPPGGRAAGCLFVNVHIKVGRTGKVEPSCCTLLNDSLEFAHASGHFLVRVASDSLVVSWSWLKDNAD